MSGLKISEAGTVQFPMVKHAAEIGWVTLTPDVAKQKRGGEAGMLLRDELEIAGETILRLTVGILDALFEAAAEFAALRGASALTLDVHPENERGIHHRFQGHGQLLRLHVRHLKDKNCSDYIQWNKQLTGTVGSVPQTVLDAFSPDCDGRHGPALVGCGHDRPSPVPLRRDALRTRGPGHGPHERRDRASVFF
mgnify:CR=1 FL=1